MALKSAITAVASATCPLVILLGRVHCAHAELSEQRSDRRNVEVQKTAILQRRMTSIPSWILLEKADRAARAGIAKACSTRTGQRASRSRKFRTLELIKQTKITR